jgi:hypothetical protein
MPTDIPVEFSDNALRWIATKCRLQSKAKEKEKAAVKTVVRNYAEHDLRGCMALKSSERRET